MGTDRKPVDQFYVVPLRKIKEGKYTLAYPLPRDGHYTYENEMQLMPSGQPFMVFKHVTAQEARKYAKG